MKLTLTIKMDNQAFNELPGADFLQTQNIQFNRERWLGYLRGECGPSGGAIKKVKIA